MKVGALAVLAATAVLVPNAGGASAPPRLVFTPFAHVVRHMTSISWDGTRFVYAENTANTIWTAPAAGAPLTQLASLPRVVEETRCVVSPGTHGFPGGALFCHAPDHKLYEIDRSGNVKTFAALPGPATPASDGALTWDSGGRYGFRLLAATGRSGNPKPGGGTLYAIDARGRVRTIGGYPGPGGADQVTLAPAGFGSVAGEALLTVDPGNRRGTVVAVSPTGRTRVVATLPSGPNPIVAIRRAGAASAGAPEPGFYLTDDLSPDIFHAPLGSLAAYAGDVLVGAETTGDFWVLEPSHGGFEVVRVRSNLSGKGRGLEAMIEVTA